MSLVRQTIYDGITFVSSSKGFTFRNSTPSTVANDGTFWAHRWLKSGADRKRIGEIETARAMIAKAIQIKPNAHFGREKYQLMILDWIVDPRAKDHSGQLTSMNLGDYISFTNRSDAPEASGLLGIVVLGNAWESVDVFHALSQSFAYQKPTLQYLAILRCRELLAKGKKSLMPDDKKGLTSEQKLRIDNESTQMLGGEVRVNLQNQTAIETVYNRLRSEAETWQTRRTAYMMTRLKAGRHPDTDKTFWRDWRDTAPPSLEVAWYSERAAKQQGRQKRQDATRFFTFVPLSLALLATLLVLRRKRLRS